MRLRLRSWADHLRASFFLLPMSAVLLAIGAGFASLAIDERLDPDRTQLPLGLSSTVDSARALLGTVAGATISFAGIAFSISLLIIQLASSQYSPRVTHTLFRDPFNKRVMATVVGTFTYCLIVLRSVRSPLEEGGQPVIPNLSVAIAVVLGIVTILAVVALIDHNAHSMDVSRILDRVTTATVAQIRREWEPRDGAVTTPEDAPEPASVGVGAVVRFARSGWVQQIDLGTLRRCEPAGSTIVVLTAPGRYAVEGTEMYVIEGTLDGDGSAEERLRGTVAIGESRTMQQDVSYGLRQIVDVALRALSPGVNDPTTAQDAIFHATVVLAEMLRREPPRRAQRREHGGWLLLPEAHTHASLVDLGFDEIRRSAAGMPTVGIYVLEALRLLRDAGGTSEALAAIDEQARRLVEGCEAAGLISGDLRTVQAAYAARFPRAAG